MRVTCPECGTQLEIVEEDPWQLDYAEDFDEDTLDEDELEDDLDEDFEDEEFEDDEDEGGPWR